MKRVEVNVTEEILNAGFNFTKIAASSRVLNLWVSLIPRRQG